MYTFIPCPAARGESPAAFGRRCIPPPPQRGCRVGDRARAALRLAQILPVTPGILTRRALSAAHAMRSRSITSETGLYDIFNRSLLRRDDRNVARVLPTDPGGEPFGCDHVEARSSSLDGRLRRRRPSARGGAAGRTVRPAESIPAREGTGKWRGPEYSWR
jgi:hypothetical protein